MPLIIIAIVLLAAIKSSSNFKYTTKIESEQQLVNTDDDQYYKYGLIYYNKNDPSLFVEKRNGIGSTLNFARPAAKISMSILGVIIIVPLLAMLIFVPGMMKERQVDINQNTIKVSGIWGPDVTKEEIAKVAIENKLPKITMKTNGADMNKKLFGMHRMEGYNNSELFLGDKTKPFVAIYLKDGSLILINYSDENKTKKLYDSIVSVMNIR